MRTSFALERRSLAPLHSGFAMSRAAAIIFVLFCGSAHATEADSFVQWSSTKFKSILTEMGAASVGYGGKLILGNCAPPDASAFDQTVRSYQEFEREALARAATKFAGRDPDSEYVQRTIVSTRNAWRRALSGSRALQAKSAFDSNCLDSADRLYREVIDLDASPHDVQLALVGMGDIRERRRQKQPTDSSFGGRWWNGK
ncbi:hypothetical protein ACFLEY_03895 [Bradyrhizobium sp. YCK136]|uniref:hypothetical protein n=1 Tax=Bradyrhizobium sp. YCK136 TaxID=3351346 RepID=UPI0037CB01BD